MRITNLLYNLGSTADPSTGNQLEVSTFSLFDEILSMISSSTPPTNKLNSTSEDQFTSAENVSIFDQLFQNNIPILNSLSTQTTSPVFDFIVNTTMKKMINDGQPEISETTPSPFDITNFMSIIDDSPTTTNGPFTREMVTLNPSESFSNLLFSNSRETLLETLGFPSTPSTVDVTNFMIINEEIVKATTFPPPLADSEDLLSLRQNETLSDLLFSNFSNEKSLKTVSNGVLIERAINLLENFSSGQQNSENTPNSENSSDSSLPRIGRSQDLDTKPNKLDLKKEVLSSVQINPIGFPGSKIFQKENGRILITKLNSKERG